MCLYGNFLAQGWHFWVENFKRFRAADVAQCRIYRKFSSSNGKLTLF